MVTQSVRMSKGAREASNWFTLIPASNHGDSSNQVGAVEVDCTNKKIEGESFCGKGFERMGVSYPQILVMAKEYKRQHSKEESRII